MSCPTTFTTSALGVGVHQITVVYSGDVNNAPSTSAALTHTVAAPLVATSTTLSGSAGSVVVGQVLTLSVSVSGDGASLPKLHSADSLWALYQLSLDDNMDDEDPELTSSRTFTATGKGATLTLSRPEVDRTWDRATKPKGKAKTFNQGKITRTLSRGKGRGAKTTPFDRRKGRKESL